MNWYFIIRSAASGAAPPLAIIPPLRKKRRADYPTDMHIPMAAVPPTPSALRRPAPGVGHRNWHAPTPNK